MIKLPFKDLHAPQNEPFDPAGVSLHHVPHAASPVAELLWKRPYGTNPEARTDENGKTIYNVRLDDEVLARTAREMEFIPAMAHLQDNGLDGGLTSPADASRMVSALLQPDVHRLMDGNPDLRDIISDPKLSARERKRLAIPILQREKEKLEASGEAMDRKLVELDGLKAALENFMAWAETAGAAVLERNDCSRLHTLFEASRHGRAFLANGTPMMLNESAANFPIEKLQTFVVEHDWAKAFEGATDFAVGEFKLPYQACAFEFRISGKTVIVLAAHDGGDDAAPVVLVPWVECGGFWLCPEDGAIAFSKLGEVTGRGTAFPMAAQQIRAISIALDAEVATHEVTRAPHKLNAKREAAGKLPLFDYHVVSLARRTRAAGLPHGSGVGTRKRLHFRRGHWRHYASFKSWVRWTLVGDPALGFIDKEYRL